MRIRHCELSFMPPMHEQRIDRFKSPDRGKQTEARTEHGNKCVHHFRISHGFPRFRGAANTRRELVGITDRSKSDSPKPPR